MNNNKYYNNTYLQKILNIMYENRIEEAIREFNKYIEMYPKDLGGYIFYAIAYMKIGDFEDAAKILDNIIILEESPEIVKDYFLLAKVLLLSSQGKYKECLTAIFNNRDVFIRGNWCFKAEVLYLKKKLDILDLEDYKYAKDKYLFGQIINYSDEETHLHIKKHMSFPNNDNLSQFVEEFPLYDVYNKLRTGILLENKNKLYESIFYNKHIFRYEANGHVGSKLVDFFEVVTFKDTDEIITMYPYENREKRPYIDLIPIEKEETNKSKVKKMSQIDKFNKRYSKN